MDSDSEDPPTPPDLVEEAKNVIASLLPPKSKHKYEKRYDLFMEWCKKKKTTKISENVMLVYLSEQSKVCNPAYLWSIYSMLKATILIKNDIDISRFKKVIAFLKRVNVGYKPKKSKTFTNDEIKMFLQNAPDEQYLLKKVVLILGISGACRVEELLKMTINDIEDKVSNLIITIPDSKTNKGRIFTVTNGTGTQHGVDYLSFCRKYLQLRPKSPTTPRLFLNYKNGKCSNHVVGKNSLGQIPKEIAQYLNIPHPNLYTGHSIRRTSATLLVNGVGTMTQLKRRGGWSSSTVSEGYIGEVPVTNNKQTADKILNQTASVIEINPTSIATSLKYFSSINV